jgi:integrase
MSGKRLFGSIRKLPSGQWQARYPDRTGRLVTAPTTYATKKEAATFLSTVEAEMARGTFIDPRGGRTTLAAWTQMWLDRAGKRANSVARDRQALDVFLGDLGDMPLAAITPMHVQSVVDARAKVAAPATVARDFSALRAVLNAAVDADLIGRSPARRVALPRVKPPTRGELTPVDLERLAAAVPARYRALVLVAGVAGLRWGEAVGLRVKDIDFLRRTITVAQVVEEVAGHLELVAEAKTTASLRTLTAPQFLVDELAHHLASHRAAARDAPEALVFVGPRGGVLRRRFGERVLAPAVKRAGLDTSLTFHALRHVAITAMVDAGVHPRVMQGRAGHATSKLTLELYAHVPQAADRLAADALQEHFRPENNDELADGGHPGRAGR